MIGYYNYTVILTYISTFFGFLGITFAWKDGFRAALICLIVSGFCDMFDGKIASTMKSRTKQEKRFGIQIDSLSDLICFGVLPAVIVLSYSDGRMIYTVISALYILGALIRLAWFNVDEEERQDKETSAREVYLGLPVTMSALIIPLIIGFTSLMEWSLENVYPWILLCVGVAFLTPFHTKKPKLIGKLFMVFLGAGCLTVVLLGVPA